MIALFTVVGFMLQDKAFTPSAPAGQAFVIVFVQDRAATVTLTANVDPNAPWKDQLVVRLKGTPGNLERWLLVVGCPGQTSSPRSGILYSEAVQQVPTPYMTVTADFGVGRSESFKLGCFSPPTTAAGFALAVLAGGAVRSASTTRLLDGNEWVKALRKAQGPAYQPARSHGSAAATLAQPPRQPTSRTAGSRTFPWIQPARRCAEPDPACDSLADARQPRPLIPPNRGPRDHE
jgi:hypothetical protein